MCLRRDLLGGFDLPECWHCWSRRESVLLSPVVIGYWFWTGRNQADLPLLGSLSQRFLSDLPCSGVNSVGGLIGIDIEDDLAHSSLTLSLFTCSSTSSAIRTEVRCSSWHFCTNPCFFHKAYSHRTSASTTEWRMASSATISIIKVLQDQRLSSLISAKIDVTNAGQAFIKLDDGTWWSGRSDNSETYWQYKFSETKINQTDTSITSQSQDAGKELDGKFMCEWETSLTEVVGYVSIFPGIVSAAAVGVLQDWM